MKKLSVVFFMVSVTVLKLFGNPSGEASNPFNQFTDASGGVSQISGSAAYSHPLLSLSTRGSMSLPVALSYSGNVDLNARADNEIAPTSWVGLGWQLGFSKIVCNHNNTMVLDDDQYTWISPEGVAYPIYFDVFESYIRYTIKDRIYVRVRCYTEGNYLRGWEITDESGNIYKYGVYCRSEGECNTALYESQNSVWNTLCWEEDGHVGKGFAGEPKPYPYQWNVAEMADIDGNWIRFSYDTIAGSVSYDDIDAQPRLEWHPDDSLYTKESYIKQITTNNGTTVTFLRENKLPEEYYVPRAGQVTAKEIDQPVYETKRLKTITVTNSYSTPSNILNITFNHEFIGAGKFRKALLTRIVVENGKADFGVNGKTATWFTYYTSPNDPKGCFGAIQSVKNNAGAETVWEYENMHIENQFREIKRELKISTNASFSSFKSGTAGDGEDFYVVMASNANSFTVYKWNNYEWEGTVCPLTERRKMVAVGPGYIVVHYGDDESVYKLFVFKWDGETWVKESCFFEGGSSLGKIQQIEAFDNHFTVVIKKDDNGFVVSSYKYDEQTSEWLGKLIFSDPFVDRAFNFGSKYCTETNPKVESGTFLDYYTWNGNQYTNRKMINRGSDRTTEMFSGGDAFVEDTYDKDDDDGNYFAYKYNGTNWQSRLFDNDGNPYHNGDNVAISKKGAVQIGQDFFIINTLGEPVGEYVVYNWLGYAWKKTRRINNRFAQLSGSNTFVERFPGTENFIVWKWDSNTSQWVRGDYGSDVYVGSSYDLSIGPQFQVATYATDNHTKFYSLVNIWDGKGWKTELIKDEFSRVVYDAGSICGSNSFLRMFSGTENAAGYELVIRRKYKDSFIQPPYNYVVKKRIVRNGIDGKDITTEFEYKNPVHNATLGTALFENVTVRQEGAGKVEHNFETREYRKIGLQNSTMSYRKSGTSEYKGRCQNIYINHHARKIAIKCSRNSCTHHGQEPFQ